MTPFDQRKIYRIIPEAENLHVTNGTAKLLEMSHLGPYLEQVILHGGITYTEETVGCSIHSYPSLNEYLTCDTCLGSRTRWISENENISGKALLKLSKMGVPEAYKNPRIWNEIKKRNPPYGKNKGNKKYLYYNPNAMSYLELSCSADRTYRKLLFSNPSAVNFVVTQGLLSELTGDQLDQLAYNEHLFPFLTDHQRDYFRKALTDDFHSILQYFLARYLLQNPAARELIRECIEIISKKKEIKYFVVALPHLFEVFFDNRHLYLENHKFRRNISRNPAAIEYITERPHLIHWPSLAANINGMSLLQPYLESILATGRHVNSTLVDNLNKNPAAVPFLRKHPALINSLLTSNPNIFEEIEKT